ncbi:MAG: response regulator [Desulfobacterales bacterium]|nr:response regulator [Desulfobacterales bacterium]
MIKALIVENNDTFREFLIESLALITSTSILSGAATEDVILSKIDTFRPDILFINFRLLGGNGLTTTRKIKTKYPGIQVILITNYDLPEYREAAYRFGADHFLSKSTIMDKDISDLVQLITHKYGP